MVKFLFYSFLLFIFLVSCKQEINQIDINLADSTYKNLYSKGFEIKYFKDYKKLIVNNPWQGASNVSYEYYLVDKNKLNDFNLKGVNVIPIPLKKIVCLSTTHLAFIDFMNETSSIYGVSGVQNISNSKILSDVNEGKVKDVGYEINLNYETILSIRPDVIFAYCIGGEATGYIKKLKDLGLNVVLVGEYLEQEPLARTEWAVFFSTFFNKDNEVKVGFDSIANEYNRLKLITDTLSVKPTVLTSMPFKDTWWIPGGKSYVSKLINDAGGNYVWDENESKESIPLNIESVFFKASKSDIWINVDNINSPEDLLKVDSRLGKFDAFKNCKVYSNNARMNMNGANDYWESGTIYPQLILKDLISIFHPNIVSNHQMYYYKNICNN